MKRLQLSIIKADRTLARDTAGRGSGTVECAELVGVQYFHLDYRSVDYFIGRIQSRLRNSSSAVLRQRFSKWDPDVHGEPALAVVAKIEMLNRVIDRLNADMAELTAHLKGVPNAVEQCIAERRALSMPDRGLLWRISIDIDSFLFEARSAHELLGKFLSQFFALIFERKITETEVLQAVRELGGDVAWVPILRDARQLFFHNAASWMAVERIQTDPPQFDLLLLKRNVEVLQPDDYLHFRDCRAIQQGLASSVKKIAIWIANEIGAAEHEEAAE